MAAAATVGFIGLGVMGRPMAEHLVTAGRTVVVHNRSSAAVDALVAAGAQAAASPAEVGGRAEVVITMLPDAPDVEDVLFGADGLTASAGPGTLVVDCSTISPAAAMSIGARLAHAGVDYVDAPVSGGQTGASAGTLAVMMGGEPAAVATATELVSPFAAVVARVGPVGCGQLVKAANQMMVAGNIALVGEALSLLRRTDVDLSAALAVLNGGLAASRVLELKAPKMLEGDFTPGFRLELHHKDIGIALAAAEQAGTAVPVTAIVAQLISAGRAAGDGALDHAVLIRAVERLVGEQSSEGGRCR